MGWGCTNVDAGIGVPAVPCWSGVDLCSVWVILALLGFPGSSGPGQWKCCHLCQLLVVYI